MKFFVLIDFPLRFDLTGFYVQISQTKSNNKVQKQGPIYRVFNEQNKQKLLFYITKALQFYFMFQTQNIHSRCQNSTQNKSKPFRQSYLAQQNMLKVNRTSLNFSHQKGESTESPDERLPNQKLQKWINFVKFHQIDAVTIWEDRYSLPVLVFVDVFQTKLGYKFSIYQIKCLFELSDNEFLKKQHFSGLHLWTRPSIPHSLLQSISTHKLLKSKKKNDQNQTITTESAIPERRSYQGKLGTISRYSKLRIEKLKKMAACDQTTKTFLKLDFRKEAINETKLQALRGTLEMNSLEKKWEFIVMAGEINKWLQETNQYSIEENESFPVYKIISNEDSFTIIKSSNGQQQVIPEVVFLKKYHTIKKKMQRQQLNSEPKQVLFTPVVDHLQANATKVQENRIIQRDKELNESLLQVMRMRNSLEYQFRILAEAAINT